MVIEGDILLGHKEKCNRPSMYEIISRIIGTRISQDLLMFHGIDKSFTF
jgi:hypothetical protein